MKNMFNEDQKNNYLDSISDNGNKHVVGVRSLFNNLADIEKHEQKDFCYFDREMMIDSIAQISGRKKNTKKWYITTLKDYIDWCVFNMLIDNNELAGVRYTDIDASRSIRFETVPNIEYLRRVIEIGFPEVNDNDVSMNTIYRLYALLLYSGMTEQEIADISKEEVKVDDNDILKYNGKEFYIHPFVRNYLNKVIPANEIVWIKFGREYHTKLLPSGKLIGCVRALDNRIGNYKNMISKLNKLYQDQTDKYIRLSVNRIYESGVYYRLLQREFDTGKIDESMIQEAFNIREEKYTKPVIYQMQMQTSKADYASWKKAWNYEQLV